MSNKPAKRTKRAKNSDAPEVTAKYYLTNATLFPAVVRAKEIGKMTDELAGMLMLLTERYSYRPSFARYSFREDMASEAMTNLCQNALKFNPEKSNNPFSYYTSCINNSFLQYLNVEKKHRRIRDQLLVDIGENPSYGFIEEHREATEYNTELSELRDQIADAKVRVDKEEEIRVQLELEKEEEKEAAKNLLDF